MRRSYILLGILALVASACGGAAASGGPAQSPTTTPATTATTAPAASHTLTVASSDLGSILVDGEGRTLYLFESDGQKASTCYDQCASNWPALTGQVAAGSGVDASLMGSTTRSDGTAQATYNGWPLYYFAGDQKPGDHNGEGLQNLWYTVSPAGDPVTGAASSGYNY